MWQSETHNRQPHDPLSRWTRSDVWFQCEVQPFIRGTLKMSFCLRWIRHSLTRMSSLKSEKVINRPVHIYTLKNDLSSNCHVVEGKDQAEFSLCKWKESKSDCEFSEVIRTHNRKLQYIIAVEPRRSLFSRCERYNSLPCKKCSTNLV